MKHAKERGPSVAEDAKVELNLLPTYTSQAEF